MKKLILISLFSFILMFSCSDENNQKNLESKENQKIETSNEVTIAEKLDLLLLKANSYVYNKIEKELKSDYNSAVFDIVWDKEQKTIYVNSIEIAAIFPIIPFDDDETSNIQSKLPDEEPRYTVECSGGTYDGVVTNCKGTVSCGKALAKCLEGGGCGTICNLETSYIYPFEPDFLGGYPESIFLTKEKFPELVVSY